MIIKDEIHGTVEFDELETRIIDSWEFQRLRFIRQMSISYLVYPGANHTRFEHSIGTAHLTQSICRHLELDPDLSKKIRIYALLHDIGHTAFSHEGEDVLKSFLGSHEQIGRKKILKGELADIISTNYNPREIADLGSSKYGSIVYSDLGADRLDYLKRDAHNTGVAYGIIDIDRILHTLKMFNGVLCVSSRGLEAAEYLLIARSTMFSTVYHHKTVRIATSMLYRAISGALEDGTVEPNDFLVHGDDIMLMNLCKSDKGGKYANAILKRNLYKSVAAIARSSLTEKEALELGEELSNKFNCDLIVDYPHLSFKPVSIKVKTDSGLLVPINDLSSLMGSLKNSEQERAKILIFASVSEKEKYEKKIVRVLNDAKYLQS